MAQGDEIKIVSQRNRANDDLTGAPRFRMQIDQNNPIRIENDWITLPLVSVPDRDFNTFPEVNGAKKVRYNNSTQAIEVRSTVPKNYSIQVEYFFDSGLRPCDVLIRFNLNDSIFFPSPDRQQYGHLIELDRLSSIDGLYNRDIYTTDEVMDFDLKVQLKCEQTRALSINYPRLVECNVFIYG